MAQVNYSRASTNATRTDAKLVNVTQGCADVTLYGRYIGRVAFSNSARMWWAYAAGDERISQWPNCKRIDAVREVVKHHVGPSAQANSNPTRTP